MTTAARGRIVMALLGLLLVAGPAGSAPNALDPAAGATPDSTFTTGPGAPGRSWLGRLFDRYLVSHSRPGEALRGKAVATVDRYRRYAGRTIEVVLVSQVDFFDRVLAGEPVAGPGFFGRLTGSLQSTTRDGTIRRQLLFRRGQRLDPFRLADSELLLRSLRFIDDVRITVLPLAGEDSTVAVVVEARDSWPLGADARVVSRDRFDASLYTVNLLGRGLAWSNELVHNAASDHEWGYHGHVLQPNPTGHFTDLDLDFEDSWRRLRRRVEFTKNLMHPGVRLVGGGMIESLDDRDNQGVPRDLTTTDLWLGRALRVGAEDVRRNISRTLLVPAIGFRKTHFRERPEVSLSVNRPYHDRTLLLAGLSLVRVRDYKTSYFYRIGETEDIRAGWDLRLTGAYEDGEFQARSGSWLELGRVTVGRRGGVLACSLGGGGYWRSGAFEEGVLDATLFAATRLYVLGNHALRWYGRARYTRGFERFPGDRLSMGNREGIRGLEDDALDGDQRLVINLETRIFTPWSLLGFRCLLLGYADFGILAGQDDSLVGKRVLNSGGVGVRLDNPRLVLPPLQVRLGVRDEAVGSDTVIEVVFGGGRRRDNFLFPSVKPEPVAYK